MDAELHACFAKWEASLDALRRYLHDDTTPAPASTSSDVTGSVTASSDTNELVIASAGLAARPGLVPASGEPLAVAPIASIHTTSVAPATCLTECAAQAVTASTPLSWVFVSSSSPATSVTNEVVSTKLSTDNEDGKHGHSFDDDEHANSNDSTPLPPAPKGCSTECALACSEPDLNTFQIAGVITAALLQEGIPELAVEPMDVALLVASSPSPPTDYNLGTNGISAAVVSMSIAGLLSAISASAMFEPMLQLQQLHNGNELFRSSSSQRIISKVPVHRPIPWPSFMCVHADGNDARPLPWPAFKEINDCESSRDAMGVLPCDHLPGWARQLTSINANGCDIWRSRLLSVRSVCVAIHALGLPDGKHSWNWHNAQPAVGQDALLVITQSVVLNYVVHTRITQEGHMFRPRLLSSFECSQEGVPAVALTVQRWLSPSSEPTSCAHSPANNYKVSAPLLAHKNSLAWFQQKSTWQLNGGCFDANTTVHFSILDVKYLIIDSYNCWGVHSHELGAETSVLLESIVCSCCYLHFGAEPVSVVDLLGGMHLSEPMPPLQDFLKTPCTEWEEAIWSGIISRAVRAFKLWCISWFKLLFLEINSEDATQWLCNDNYTAVQHFNESVPFCVHPFSPALFLWEIAWRLEGSKNCTTDNLPIDGKEVLITWPLPNVAMGMEASKICPAAMLELQGSTHKIFSDGLVNSFAEWLQSLVQLNYQDQDVGLASVCKLSVRNIQAGLGLSDGDICSHFLCWDPGGRCVMISVARHLNRDSSSVFIDCMCFNGLNILHIPWAPAFLMLRPERGELIQWLANSLLGTNRIWLLASTIGGQAPFQGGRDICRSAVPDQVRASHGYYITFFIQTLVGYNYYLASINQILVDCDYNLNQAYSFDMVCTDIIYYLEEYHGDSRETKEVHMPWDPGIISPLITCEASAWGQAEFQGGRDVRTLACTISLGRHHGLPTRCGPAHSPLWVVVTYKYSRKGDGNGIQWITANERWRG